MKNDGHNKKKNPQMLGNYLTYNIQTSKQPNFERKNDKLKTKDLWKILHKSKNSTLMIIRTNLRIEQKKIVQSNEYCEETEQRNREETKNY